MSSSVGRHYSRSAIRSNRLRKVSGSSDEVECLGALPNWVDTLQESRFRILEFLVFLLIAFQIILLQTCYVRWIWDRHFGRFAIPTMQGCITQPASSPYVPGEC